MLNFEQVYSNLNVNYDELILNLRKRENLESLLTTKTIDYQKKVNNILTTTDLKDLGSNESIRSAKIDSMLSNEKQEIDKLKEERRKLDLEIQINNLRISENSKYLQFLELLVTVSSDSSISDQAELNLI
jgi:hypothetical protein